MLVYQRVVLLDFQFQYVIICHPGPQDPRTQEEQFAKTMQLKPTPALRISTGNSSQT